MLRVVSNRDKRVLFASFDCCALEKCIKNSKKNIIAKKGIPFLDECMFVHHCVQCQKRKRRIFGIFKLEVMPSFIDFHTLA